LTGPGREAYSWPAASGRCALAVKFRAVIGSEALALGRTRLPQHVAFAPDRSLFLQADG